MRKLCNPGDLTVSGMLSYQIGAVIHYQERQKRCLQGPPEINNHGYTFPNGRGERRSTTVSGRLSTPTRRRRTYNIQKLTYKNNHPQAHKRSYVKTLFKRAETQCSTPEAKEEEFRYLKRQFSLNGYQSSFIQKTLR